jgi:hypothetical protein
MRFDRAMMERTLAEILVNPMRGAVGVLELGGSGADSLVDLIPVKRIRR